MMFIASIFNPSQTAKALSPGVAYSGPRLKNQNINQLVNGIQNAVFGNVQSKIFFGVGAENGDYIKKNIPDGSSPKTYVSCPNYFVTAHLSIEDELISPFIIKAVLAGE